MAIDIVEESVLAVEKNKHLYSVCIFIAQICPFLNLSKSLGYIWY